MWTMLGDRAAPGIETEWVDYRIHTVAQTYASSVVKCAPPAVPQGNEIELGADELPGCGGGGILQHHDVPVDPSEFL